MLTTNLLGEIGYALDIILGLPRSEELGDILDVIRGLPRRR